MVVKRKLKLLSVLALFAGITLVAVLVTMLFRGGNQEEKLSKKLETVGADFYENFYHSQISSNKTEEEVKEFLERFKEIGIKVDIDNLSRFDDKKYADLDKEFINKKDNIPCDVRNTRAVIYPKEPYGAKDFTVKGSLDCGFESPKTNEKTEDVSKEDKE